MPTGAYGQGEKARPRPQAFAAFGSVDARWPAMVSKKAILKAVTYAYDSAAWAAYADAVVDLARLQPRDFAATLDRERLLPRQVSDGMCDAFRERANDVAGKAASSLFDALAEIDRRLTAIRTGTDGLSLWNMPVAPVFQFAAAIEEQWSVLNDLMLTSLPSARAFPQAFLGDCLTAADGMSASASTLHEELAETFQVVLAHVQTTFKERVNDMPAAISFGDNRDFRELVALVQIWRSFDDLRQHVIYMGWRAHIDNGKLTFAPTDVVEYRRIEIGRHRRLEQLTVGATFVLRRIGVSAEYRQAQDAVVASLRPPSPLEGWNGDVDRGALRRMASSDPMIDAQDSVIVAFLYQPIALELVVGKADVPWPVLNRVSNGLRQLASAMSEKLRYSDPSTRSVLVDPEVLAAVLSDACGITKQRTLDALDLLTFDASRREAEIWDTPLLRAPRERFLLIPQLILNGMALRRLENFATERDPNLFDKRGGALEEFVKLLFVRGCTTWL